MMEIHSTIISEWQLYTKQSGSDNTVIFIKQRKI